MKRFDKTDAARSMAALLAFSLAAAAPAWAQSHKVSAADIQKEIQNGGPSTVRRAPDNLRIADRYIVMFAPGVADPHQEGRDIVRQLGGTLHHTYGHALQGFAATLSPAAVEQLRHDPRVLMIEEDRIAHGTALPVPVSPQAPAPSWALDRIDQRGPQLDNSFSFPASAGGGVHIYIIDGGILGGINGTAGAHIEFDGRLGDGADFITPSTNGNDCFGHGTFVASLAAGTTLGVAKLATLHPVRVADCSESGSASTIIAGVNWVTSDHLAHPGQKSVANVSLTIHGTDPAVDQAVQNSINAGVVYTIAAGNDGGRTSFASLLPLGDACGLSPQRVGAALTVGEMDDTGVFSGGAPDIVAPESDTGGCVDLYAPGAKMTGASIVSTTAISGPPLASFHHGTSYAAPLVAGVAATYLAAHPKANAAQAMSAIIANATINALDFSVSSGFGGPNRLLYSDFQTDIQATVSSNQGAPQVGAQFTYTFQVKNSGPYNSMDPVLFTDNLPGGLGVVNVPAGAAPAVTTTRGFCSGAVNISCDLGRLAVGESAVITVTVIATTPQTFTNTGTAKLQSGQTDRAPANDSASVTLTSR